MSELIDRGNGLIYDTVLGMTWLADANLAASETFGIGGIESNGAMSYETAVQFINAMNANNFKGINTWRLPIVEPLDETSGWNFIRTFDGSTDYSYWKTAPIDALYNPNGQSEGRKSDPLSYMYYNNMEALGRYIGSGTDLSGELAASEWGINNARNQTNLSLFANIKDIGMLNCSGFAYYWGDGVAGAPGLDERLTPSFSFYWGFSNARNKNTTCNTFVWPVTPGDPAGPQTGTLYRVTRLNTGSFSSARAINNNGDIAGTGSGLTSTGAFLWDQSGISEIAELPGGSDRIKINAMNDSCEVVGKSNTYNNFDHAFKWSKTSGITDLGFLSSNGNNEYSEAHDINNSGLIVGESSVSGNFINEIYPSEFIHGFSSQGTDMNDLGTLTRSSSAITVDTSPTIAYGVNDNGEIAGTGTKYYFLDFEEDASGEEDPTKPIFDSTGEGVIWNNGNISELTRPPKFTANFFGPQLPPGAHDFDITLKDINNSGQMFVEVIDNDNIDEDGVQFSLLGNYFYDNDNYTYIEPGGLLGSWVFGTASLNDDGVIVGTSRGVLGPTAPPSQQGLTLGFRWDSVSQETELLTSLIHPDDPLHDNIELIVAANDINNYGQIAADALIDGNLEAVLLTPNDIEIQQNQSCSGEIAKKHIIVMTHGWQCGGGSCSEFPNEFGLIETGVTPTSLIPEVDNAIYNQILTDNKAAEIELLAFNWPEAYFGPLPLVISPTNWFQGEIYKPALKATKPAGKRLGYAIKDKLDELTANNPNNEVPSIHLIGHSLGTMTNAYAIQKLNELGINANTHEIQVTILDAPKDTTDGVKIIEDSAPYLQFILNGMDSLFFLQCYERELCRLC